MARSRPGPLALLVLAAAVTGAQAVEPAASPPPVAFAPLEAVGFAPGTAPNLDDTLMAACPRFVLPLGRKGDGPGGGGDRVWLARRARARGATHLVVPSVEREPAGSARLVLVLFGLPSLAEVGRVQAEIEPADPVPGAIEALPSPPDRESLSATALELTERLLAPLEPLPSPCLAGDPEPGWLGRAASLPSGSALCAAVDAFYESRGPFAGTYAMDAITAVRVVPGQDGGIRAHVRYRYRHLGSGPAVPIPVGHDQRSFDLVPGAEGWDVSVVGPYLSGEP